MYVYQKGSQVWIMVLTTARKQAIWEGVHEDDQLVHAALWPWMLAGVVFGPKLFPHLATEEKNIIEFGKVC